MNQRQPGGVVGGRYRLVALIGQGGLGEVYKAFDDKLKRLVAIKFPGRASAETTPDVFEREAETAARVLHPNIARVIDVGDADGVPYIVADFIEGSSLAEILRGGAFIEHVRASEIIAQIGDALASLHRAGLVHGDVKPSNILIAASGQAYLSDFGTAVGRGHATATVTGLIAGTPRYMSPEQAKGECLDGRSDIYSLAIVLYEALTGRSWLPSDIRSPAEILRRVVETPLPPAREINPAVPGDISRIIERALAKDAADRYATADDFVDALHAATSRPRMGVAEALSSFLVSSGLKRDNRADASPGPEISAPDDLPATAGIAPYGGEPHQRMNEFAAMWDRLIAAAQIGNKKDFVAAADTFVRNPLREAIGYGIEQTIPYFKGTFGYMVEAPFLWIRHSRFPIIFVAYDSGHPDLLATLVHQLEIAKAIEFFAIIIVVSVKGDGNERDVAEVRHTVADSVYRRDFVVLDRTHVASLIEANTSKRLIEIILEQGAELQTLSPYVVTGPVPGNMFFGRESELKTICQSILRDNYAIVGGRRIGKSSVLLRLKRLFDDDPRYRAVYLDCEALFDHHDFFVAVNDLVPSAVDADPVAFRTLVASLREQHPGRTVVFLFDEVDELLAFDAGRQPPGQLFKAFRAASNQGACRFVFSGSRTLFRHLRDPASPFFNFCETLTLARLEDKSIAEIVLRPMQQLGLEIRDEGSFVSRLIELTSCHPNIAQWLCDRLVRSTVGRRITVQALDQLSETPEFREHYVTTAWGDANATEKLISLLMEVPVFSEEAVAQRLVECGLPQSIGVVQQSLEILRLYSLFEREGLHYRFGMARFPRVVRESREAAAQIELLASEVRSACS